MQDGFAVRIDISKTDEAERLVFGWLSIAEDSAGAPVVDLQGDVIPVAELEKAAYEYVAESRRADAMHDQTQVGQLVESFVLTPEKRAALGITGGPAAAWWVGVRVDAPTFDRVRAGELRAFSIGGRAERVPA